MSGREREIALAVLGLVGFGAVVTVFGALRDEAGPTAPVQPSVAIQAPAANPNAAAPATVPRQTQAALVPPAAAPAAPQALPQAAPQAAAPAVPRPAFDVVRVEPTGESVIAGRAMPGATVELLRDGAVHDRTQADGAGLFAFVSPPLPPGASQVSLRATPSGGAPVLSEQSVTVVVAAGRNESPVVALASPDRPTALLSAPSTAPGPEPVKAPETAPGAAPPPASAEAGKPRPGVRVETVEAEEGGKLLVSGRAAPGATVRLYLNDTHIASGAAAADGRISFSIRRGVSPGDYRVRLDDAEGGTGSVLSRAEVNFAMPRAVVAALPPAADSASRPPAIPPLPAEPGRAAPGVTAPGPNQAVAPSQAPAPPRAATASADPSVPGRAGDPGVVVVPQIDTAVVSRGDSLWRISRRIYGSGLRYTVIYDANREQVRNPDRIYPGQVFVLPGETTAAAR